MEGEVELVEGLVVRQPGELQGVAEPAALPQPELLFEEEIDEVEVAHLAGLGAVNQFGDDLGQVAQAEPGRMVPDPVSGQAAHRVPPLVMAAVS